jgi:hypothetical protein
LFFSGLVLFALALTTGTFAYTYAGATTATLDGTTSEEEAITYEPSDDQPAWEYILPQSEYASEILLPCAAGDETDIPFPSPCSEEHWRMVSNMPANDGATYVANSHPTHYRTDLYKVTASTSDHPEKIHDVTVYFRFAGVDDKTAYARAVIKTHGTVYEGREESQTGEAYITDSCQWRVNPDTGKIWTWPEVRELQAGVSLKTDHATASCTQVYVAVNYEFRIIQGEVPPGELYHISPNPDYTGDLQVRVYLTNTGDLLKAYRYLNMELYVKGSLEAKKRLRYQVLSIENGVAVFNIEGGTAKNYTVELTGGGYRLISGDPGEWGEGWNIVPEFYCEVTQR